MSAAQLRSAFAVAAAVVAAALVALALAGGEPAPPARARAERAGPTVGGGPNPALLAARRRTLRVARERAAASRSAREDLPRPHDRRPDGLHRREQRAAARSFLRALLRCERGQSDKRTRRELRQGATHRLAALVLSAPPRVPDGVEPPPRGRVVAIEALRGDRRLGEVVATVERGRRRSALLVELVRGRGEWLVASLR